MFKRLLMLLVTASFVFAQDDADIPPRFRGRITEDQYQLLRDKYLNLLRGLPADPSLRENAIKLLESQRRGASGLSQAPLTWTPIGPSPIPNGQVDGSLSVTGRVTAFQIDPNNSSKVYLGTAQGGVYRSLDGGTTWLQIFDGANSSAIGALALAPSDTTKLFVGTGEANLSGDSYAGVGLYRIDNCDTTATLVGPINPVRNYNDGSNNPQSVPVFTGRSISSILVHPTDPTTVYVGTNSGIMGIGADSPGNGQIPPLGILGLYRLTNATSAPGSVGVTKLTVTLANGGFDTPNTGNRGITDMVFEPGNPNNMLVWVYGVNSAGDGGVYRSTNAQAATPSFTQTLTSSTNGARASFAIYKQASAPTVVAYLASGEGGSGRLRVSTDGGATWSAFLNGGQGFCDGQCFYNIGLDVLPGPSAAQSDDILVLGGNVASASTTHLFAKSTNGGASFTESSSGLHADTHFIRIDPNNPNAIYHGDDGGIFKSVNGGSTWASLNTMPLNTVQFSGLAVHPTDANWAIGGTQDNGTNLRMSNGSWMRVDFGDGGYALVDRNATDTTNVTLYHTYFNQTNNLIGFARVLSAACASDGNWSFKGIYGGSVDPTPHCDSSDTFNGISINDPVLFYAPMELGPGNPSPVYFGAGKVYRSTDKGQTMSVVSQASSVAVSSIAVSPQDDNYRMFGREDGAVFFTTSGATTMTALSGIPAKFIARVKFDPSNKNTAYVALGGYFGGTSTAQSHVWKVTNLNTAPVVTGINSGLPDVPVNSFAVHPTNSNVLFAGTDIGVYGSTNGGTTWVPYGTGLPVVAVFGAEIQAGSNKLRIATHGRGMWEIDAGGVISGTPDLTIAKMHSGNFTQGQTGATYTITVTNSGTASTSGTVTVVDTLPTGLTATAISGSGWSCTLATLTCTRSDALAATSSYAAITLTVNVAANAPASVTNSVTVSGGGETNTANDTATDPTTVNVPGTPDLTIAKMHSGNFTQGQTGATYTITVTNSGTASTSGTVTVVDTLPTGLTATAISGSGWSCTLATLTCTRSDALAATSSYAAITLTVNVAANAPASVTNSVTVSGGGETNTANDTATDPTTVNASGTPDLTIAKMHSGNFTQGQTGATYTITVTNSGTASTSGTVTVVDTLPTGLTATAISGSGWSCTLATLTCTRSDALAATSSYAAITLTVNVAANAPASVTNSVTVSGGGETNTANDTATDPTTINVPSGPDLTVTKTHAANFTQGQNGATYTITVTNSGTASTTGTVSVVDTLPAGLTPVSIAGGGLWLCNPGTLTCTRNDALAANTSYPPITLTVNVSATAPSSVTNSVTVSGGGESNTANDTATDPTTINASGTPDLTVAKMHAGNFTQNQAGATYTITVTNSGTASTSGTVTVVDSLPAGLTATAIAGSGWSCTLGTLTCTRSDALASSSSYAAITLTVNVAANAPSSVTNSVTVSGGGETNTANDTAMDPTTINPSGGPPDLTIAKMHAGNFTQGQTGATYSIVVTNSGTTATSGTVTVVDTLPSGLTATGIAGSGWSCSLGTLTCTRSDALASSSSYAAITLTVNVAANAPSSVTNSATVSGGGETNTANDTAMDLTTINAASGGPDLTVTKTHVGNFMQGQNGATYTITVTNSGSVATTGAVHVVDTLPAGLTAVSFTGGGLWVCNPGALTCTRNDALGAGASYPPITLIVNVAANAPPSVTNSATVSGGGETNTSNDTANDPTTINPSGGGGTPDLTIAKSHTGNFTQGQTGATYTITVSNSGTASTSGTVTVVDTLPSGLTATAIAGSGWSCTLGTLTCTRSDALATSSSYAAITLTVNVAGNAASTVTNSVTVSGGGETNTANDTATDPTTINPSGGTPDMTISKSHTGNFTQGQTGATYTITVTNSGTASTSGTVTVVDTLPAGLTATAIAGSGWSCTLGTLTCTRSDALATSSSYASITLTVSVAANAPSSVTNSVTVSGGGETNTANDTATNPTTINAAAGGPDLTVAKMHSGNFMQGQIGAMYTITVTNSGSAATVGTVTVVETLPAGLTATSFTGGGLWVCNPGNLTCTRNDSLPAGNSYPPITLVVNVSATAPSSVTNQVTVSGGGESNTANDTATDPTTINPAGAGTPDLTIAKMHSGNFVQGQTGATYTIMVTNTGTAGTSGTVTVTDALPSGLTATAIAGTGWSCTLGTLSCTRSDALAMGSSYPTITLTVNVAANAPSNVTNSATVSGGGESNTANDTATDPTTINATGAGAPVVTSVTPINGMGANQVFNVVYTDPAGQADLSMMQLLFNNTLNMAGACWVIYDRSTNTMYLENDAGTGVVPQTVNPGGAGTATNSHCTISSGGPVTTSANTLTLPVHISFNTVTFAGTKQVWGNVTGFDSLSSGWTLKGTWKPL